MIAVSGLDRHSFLQGLITGDIHKISDGGAIYAAFLSAQGKYQHDFFVGQNGDYIWIDIDKNNLPDLLKRMNLYKLRANVQLSDISDQYRIHAIFPRGNTPPEFADGAFIYPDPRLADLGWRAIATSTTMIPQMGTVVDIASYDYFLATHGIPTQSSLEKDRTILLENGFDELHAIDWDKGCYLGQELTARTRYRGLVRKRLIPFAVTDNAAPIQTGGIVTFTAANGESHECGEIKSIIASPDTSKPNIAMVMARVE
ncbi:MAG: folate-binding protein, partial [Proteobacteria bacterium]|nr:folate-binding protein [Pseudomonadota bacterium]